MKKVKVLHLFEQYLPKTEVWVYNVLRYLNETEVHIGANHYLKHNFYNPDFKYIDNYYDGLRAENAKLGKLSVKNFIKKLMIKLTPQVFESPADLFIDHAKSNDIDIIHVHFGKVAWHFREIPKALNLPFVVSFYGWDYEMLPYLHPVYENRYRQLFKLADCFICEGHHGAKILEAKGCPTEKIKVVNLGVETDNIPFHQRFKEQKRLKLLQIASFTTKKGYYYTVEAFANALKTCPDMNLCLVGNEREKGVKDQIREQIKRKGLEGKIELLATIEYARLYEFMKDFDIFIHPSHYADNRDCEGGAPIILLDAQATGMPVVSTRHCDIPEEVIHEQTGILTAEKDIDGLAKAIERFYLMDDLAFIKFSINARNHVLKNYNVQNTSKWLQSIYHEILNEK